ncbi:hypothetical protein UlMin_008173 [Ulmus minor]
MAKGPGLYFDIGKKARDVLYKDFDQKPTFHLINYRGCDWSFDLSCKIQEILPGLSALVSLVLPNAAKVESQFIHDYFGITGGFGLKEDPIIGGYNPTLNFSSVIGGVGFAFGSEFGFEIPTRTLYKFNHGFTFNTDDLVASFTLDKLDILKASCYYAVDKVSNTGIAAEMKHSFSMNETTFSIGAEHAMFPLTVLKGKINSHGKVAALVQQNMWDKCFMTLGGEVDFMDSRRIPNLGLSMAFRV